MNHFHNHDMAIPLAHRTLGGWKNLFRKADIKCFRSCGSAISRLSNRQLYVCVDGAIAPYFKNCFERNPR